MRRSALRLPFLRASLGFSVFLASSPFAASAGSYHFESVALSQQHRPPTPAGR
ncbi:DUF1010 domain-containing protein [uncultured Acidovorax sp.]|uniref:DUF1010 domain-containing protein n=1 Tax=uncultured Acidovorax sp. TaxID=158751 RepID=UPI00338E161B